MKKIYIAIILIGFGLFISSLVLFSKDIIINPKKSLASLSFDQQMEEFKDSEITIFAVGDIMLDRGVEYMIKKEGKGDFRFPFLKIAGDLEKAEFWRNQGSAEQSEAGSYILFGNLEGPISTKGEKVGSIYSFRADPKVVEGLKYAGFDILSLANNHTLDYGRIALKDTMTILKSNGIDYVGAGFDEEETFSVKIKEIRGQKIGFLAYTNLGSKFAKAGENSSGMAWISEKDIGRIKKEIEEAKKKVDVLIISLHSGQEYSFEPTNFQVKFGKACIEAGADIILGHHPHVVQKIEKYQDGWIAYSLGNFVFDQGFSQETMKGLLLEIRVINGRIVEVNSREVKISKFFQPYFED